MSQLVFEVTTGTLIKPSFEKQDCLADEILKLKNCVVPVLKVARAGATTSLIKNAIENRKRVVIFEPTHRIGEDTVKNAVHYSGKGGRILELLDNRKLCRKLQTECQKNTNLDKMKWLLRPEDCKKCAFLNDPSCKLQEILNCHKWDVLLVTYQKLKALILSEEYSEVSQTLLKKLFKADVAIFDEYTTGLLGLAPSIEISEETLTSVVSIVLDDADKWWTSILIVASAAQDFSNHLKNSQSGKFSNPLCEEELAKLQANFIAVWNKIKCLTQKGVETEYIQEMLQIGIHKELFIHKDHKGHVTVTPIEPLSQELSFINRFADKFALEDKLSILVDAHMPQFELQSHFHSKVEPFIWGDPNKTNNKIVYFCDSKKIGEADVYHEKTQKYLQDSINEICSFHGESGRVLIVCINKAVAEKVERWQKDGLIANVEVTWYRSTITRGVQAKNNVQIMIGGPYIPLASYLYKVAKEQNIVKADAWNKAFRKTNIDAEFINASSRVKDPLGVKQSYVYCLGITKIEIANFLNLQGALYETGDVKKPSIVSYAKTGVNAKMWTEMTSFYQHIGKNCEEKDIPYLLELTRVFTKVGNRVQVQRVFREKAKEATEAFLKNTKYLMSLDLYIEKHGRGFILMLNDKKPY